LNIYELPTPVVLVDLDRVERNVRVVANLARSYGKCLWPMFKTTKSSFIARLQRDVGSDGFLCSGVAEAEVLVSKGVTRTVMIAYPIADEWGLSRVARLIENGARVIVRIDNLRVAEFLSNGLRSRGFRIEYCVKVDVGYGRLGVKPEDVGLFVSKLSRFNNLEFVGIVTHQGQAYKARNPQEVEAVAKRSAELMELAVKSLRRYGFEPEIVGAGSTPTLRFDVREGIYTHLFPGNYVYYDRTQALVYGSASIDDCALTILATVTSIPQHSSGRIAIINAGSRYIERDVRGGLRGYGQLVEHPKVVVTRVSQEIAVLDISEEGVEVGEKVRIIPNHSCYTNNAVNFIVGHRGGKVVGIIPLDAKEDRVIEEELIGIPRIT